VTLGIVIALRVPGASFPGNIFRLFQLYAVKGETEMNKFLLWLINPPADGPKSTLLLRLMAGGVFFWEGLLKFVYVNQGVGRFAKLGIPFPHFTAAFIGYLEIFGGLLLLTGLTTRLTAVPFIAEMIVAVLSTKISLYLGTSPLPLPPALPQVGFWAVLHEIRSDYAQILTVIFLLINGPGKWSLDAVLLRKWGQGAVSDRVPSGRLLDLSAAAYR
jgi:putative oxidoreductase